MLRPSLGPTGAPAISSSANAASRNIQAVIASSLRSQSSLAALRHVFATRAPTVPLAVPGTPLGASASSLLPRQVLLHSLQEQLRRSARLANEAPSAALAACHDLASLRQTVERQVTALQNNPDLCLAVLRQLVKLTEDGANFPASPAAKIFTRKIAEEIQSILAATLRGQLPTSSEGVASPSTSVPAPSSFSLPSPSAMNGIAVQALSLMFRLVPSAPSLSAPRLNANLVAAWADRVSGSVQSTLKSAEEHQELARALLLLLKPLDPALQTAPVPAPASSLTAQESKQETEAAPVPEEAANNEDKGIAGWLWKNPWSSASSAKSSKTSKSPSPGTADESVLLALTLSPSTTAKSSDAASSSSSSSPSSIFVGLPIEVLSEKCSNALAGLSFAYLTPARAPLSVAAAFLPASQGQSVQGAGNEGADCVPGALEGAGQPLVEELRKAASAAAERLVAVGHSDDAQSVAGAGAPPSPVLAWPLIRILSACEPAPPPPPPKEEPSQPAPEPPVAAKEAEKTSASAAVASAPEPPSTIAAATATADRAPSSSTDVAAASVATTPAETPLPSFLSLAADPSAIIITGLQVSGESAARALRRHFSRFGHVTAVQALSSSPAHHAPGIIPHLVRFADPSSASDALAKGDPLIGSVRLRIAPLSVVLPSALSAADQLPSTPPPSPTAPSSAPALTAKAEPTKPERATKASKKAAAKAAVASSATAPSTPTVPAAPATVSTKNKRGTSKAEAVSRPEPAMPVEQTKSVEAKTPASKPSEKPTTAVTPIAATVTAAPATEAVPKEDKKKKRKDKKPSQAAVASAIPPEASVSKDAAAEAKAKTETALADKTSKSAPASVAPKTPVSEAAKVAPALLAATAAPAASAPEPASQPVWARPEGVPPNEWCSILDERSLLRDKLRVHVQPLAELDTLHRGDKKPATDAGSAGAAGDAEKRAVMHVLVTPVPAPATASTADGGAKASNTKKDSKPSFSPKLASGVIPQPPPLAGGDVPPLSEEAWKQWHAWVAGLSSQLKERLQSLAGISKSSASSGAQTLRLYNRYKESGVPGLFDVKMAKSSAEKIIASGGASVRLLHGFQAVLVPYEGATAVRALKAVAEEGSPLALSYLVQRTVVVSGTAPEVVTAPVAIAGSDATSASGEDGSWERGARLCRWLGLKGMPLGFSPLAMHVKSFDPATRRFEAVAVLLSGSDAASDGVAIPPLPTSTLPEGISSFRLAKEDDFVALKSASEVKSQPKPAKDAPAPKKQKKDKKKQSALKTEDAKEAASKAPAPAETVVSATAAPVSSDAGVGAVSEESKGLELELMISTASLPAPAISVASPNAAAAFAEAAAAEAVDLADDDTEPAPSPAAPAPMPLFTSIDDEAAYLLREAEKATAALMQRAPNASALHTLANQRMCDFIARTGAAGATALIRLAATSPAPPSAEAAAKPTPLLLPGSLPLSLKLQKLSSFLSRRTIEAHHLERVSSTIAPPTASTVPLLTVEAALRVPGAAEVAEAILRNRNASSGAGEASTDAVVTEAEADAAALQLKREAHERLMAVWWQVAPAAEKEKKRKQAAAAAAAGKDSRHLLVGYYTPNKERSAGYVSLDSPAPTVPPSSEQLY